MRTIIISNVLPVASDAGGVEGHCRQIRLAITRLTLDLLVAFTVKATQASQALVKLWSLFTVCLSTSLLCHQVLNSIS